MGINIRFEEPRAIAEAAYLGGLGQYRQRAFQQNLQAQQLAQQDDQFRRNLAARLFQQQQAQLANEASQVFNANRQLAFWDKQRQDLREDSALRRTQEVADNQQKQEWHLADQVHLQKMAEDNRKFLTAQDQARNDFSWNKAGIESTEQAIDNQVKHVANNMDLLQPGDMEDFRKLYNNWNAIRSSRVVKSDPKAYGEALQQFATNFAKSGVIERMKPRLSTLEQIKSETQVEPVYSPDGTFMGNRVWTPTFRNGQRSWQPRMEAYKPDSSAAIRSARTVDDYWAAMAPADREKLYESARLEMPVAKAGEPLPSPGQVVQFAKTRLAQIHGLALPGQSQPSQLPPAASLPPLPPQQQVLPPSQPTVPQSSPANGPGQPPQPPQSRLPVAGQPGESDQARADLHAYLLGLGGEPDIVHRTTPAMVAAISKQVGPNPPPGFDPVKAAYLQASMQQLGEQNARSRGETHAAPPGGKVLHASALPAATLSKLPVLSTKEEVARYRAARGAGAPFVGPNGTIYHTN